MFSWFPDVSPSSNVQEETHPGTRFASSPSENEKEHDKPDTYQLSSENPEFNAFLKQLDHMNEQPILQDDALEEELHQSALPIHAFTRMKFAAKGKIHVPKELKSTMSMVEPPSLRNGPLHSSQPKFDWFEQENTSSRYNTNTIPNTPYNSLDTSRQVYINKLPTTVVARSPSPSRKTNTLPLNPSHSLYQISPYDDIDKYVNPNVQLPLVKHASKVNLYSSSTMPPPKLPNKQKVDVETPTTRAVDAKWDDSQTTMQDTYVDSQKKYSAHNSRQASKQQARALQRHQQQGALQPLQKKKSSQQQKTQPTKQYVAPKRQTREQEAHIAQKRKEEKVVKELDSDIYVLERSCGIFHDIMDKFEKQAKIK